MTKNELTKQKWMQAASCLLCVVVTWRYAAGLDGEFLGGRITGKLLNMWYLGELLLAISIVVTLFFPRNGAVMILISGLMSLPLYLYFLAPGPFRWVFRGEYSVPAFANFVWDNWSVWGVATVLFAMCIATQTLMLSRREDLKKT